MKKVLHEYEGKNGLYVEVLKNGELYVAFNEYEERIPLDEGKEIMYALLEAFGLHALEGAELLWELDECSD